MRVSFLQNCRQRKRGRIILPRVRLHARQTRRFLSPAPKDISLRSREKIFRNLFPFRVTQTIRSVSPHESHTPNPHDDGRVGRYVCIGYSGRCHMRGMCIFVVRRCFTDAVHDRNGSINTHGVRRAGRRRRVFPFHGSCEESR